jgi:hypothetical protein
MMKAGLMITMIAGSVAHAQWEQTDKLEATDPDEFDFYAYKLELSSDGSTLAVSCPNDDDAGPDAGVVYFYERDKDGQFQVVQKLYASGDDLLFFGESVAMSGDTLIGATATPGSAFVFERV